MQQLELSSLIAAIQRRHGLETKVSVARLLGVTDTTLANWLRGRNYPNPHYAKLIAELAGQDVDTVCAYMEAKRATDEEAREMWLRIVRRLMFPGGLTAKIAAAAAMVSIADPAALI